MCSIMSLDSTPMVACQSMAGRVRSIAGWYDDDAVLLTRVIHPL